MREPRETSVIVHRKKPQPLWFLKQQKLLRHGRPTPPVRLPRGAELSPGPQEAGAGSPGIPNPHGGGGVGHASQGDLSAL